jgi:hypothetical protein
MGPRPVDRKKRRPLRLALSLLILLAGCVAADKSDSDKSDDDSRHGGFYGGLSGGVTRLP